MRLRIRNERPLVVVGAILACCVETSRDAREHDALASLPVRSKPYGWRFPTQLYPR